MDGQWIGRYTGTNNGLAVLDVDDEGTHFLGSAIAFDDDVGMPGTIIELNTADRADDQAIETSSLAFIKPGTATVATAQQIASEHPGLILPSSVKIQLKRIGSSIHVDWTTNIATKGEGELVGSECEKPSSLVPNSSVISWEEFKHYAFGLDQSRYIFRGQDCSKRLRTSFHRSRRKDLVRYLVKDIPTAHRALTARTRHLFDLRDSTQNGAFLNLLQHHSFPTPLLDWTRSPFVAAFFAYRFRRHPIGEPPNTVRIFIFDRMAWERRWNQVQSLAFAQPHFSILEALSIENPRAIPQQAVSSVTNIDDIEAYISNKEQEAEATYLQAVDLPFAERRTVLEELSVMGITAGALFPGIDGACEELRGRLFRPVE